MGPLINSNSSVSVLNRDGSTQRSNAEHKSWHKNEDTKSIVFVNVTEVLYFF